MNSASAATHGVESAIVFENTGSFGYTQIFNASHVGMDSADILWLTPDDLSISFDELELLDGKTNAGIAAKFATTDGTGTDGFCVEWDANGDLGDALSGAACGSGGADADAVHVNAPGEISIIDPKGTPTTSDFLIIEDAADSNAKKSITIGDLPGAGGGYDEVLDNGTPETQRSQLNFIGAGVDCEDNIGETRTDCTFTGGGDGGGPIVITRDYPFVYVDGQFCRFPVAVQINSGPRMSTVVCDHTSDSGEMELNFVLPDGWDDTADMTMYWQGVNVNASPSGNTRIDIETQCRADGTVINNTWQTPITTGLITWNGAQYDIETSAAIVVDPDGACTQAVDQRRLFVRASIDATTSTSTQGDDVNIIGLIVEFTWSQDDTE
jgi:hypothetical protein